ncbi:STAS domain-containing protein [Streptomyces sp. NPDC127108]|uniref:STAS domain-containing protein n=1 Tax=Streptomyces sp. NPDC127108 TaxID=3345361 RepID=UPI003645AC80
MRLSIQDASTNQHALLYLAGELDYATIPVLCDRVVDLMATGRRRVTLDLSAFTQCDTASLYTLLGIRSALQHADGSLTLTAASPAVRHALDHNALYASLPLASDTEHIPPQPSRPPGRRRPGRRRKQAAPRPRSERPAPQLAKGLAPEPIVLVEQSMVLRD